MENNLEKLCVISLLQYKYEQPEVALWHEIPVTDMEVSNCSVIKHEKVQGGRVLLQDTIRTQSHC